MAACPECQSRLPSIQAEDEFVSGFRAQAATPPPADNLIDQLAERLRGLVLTWPAAPDLSQLDATQELNPYLGFPQLPDEIGRLGGYRVLRAVGRGGMGVVYQAEDIHLKRLVALKAMVPRLAADPTARRRFLREAQAMAAGHHDHIAAIYQVYEDKGVPFMAMEFLQGTPLDKWLKQGCKPTVAEVLRIGREIAEGLAAAHGRGLIHRDIKPGNIWLDSDHGGRVKILDFGLAHVGAEDIHLTHSGTVVGTPAYMAPEQARGEKVDARTDLFSLGCVLYRLCTGVLPFRGDNSASQLMSLALDRPRPVREFNPDAPAELDALITRLLEKDPALRPASARETANAIRSLEQRLAGMPAPVVTPRRRTGVIVGLLLGGILAAAAVAAVLIIRDKDGKKVGEVPLPPGARLEVIDGDKKTDGAAAPKPLAGDSWVKQVAALPAEKQVEVVIARLKELNPGFDGKVVQVIQDGVVRRLEFSTEEVTDVSPVRALTGLRVLGANLQVGSGDWTKSRLADISPLKDLQLTALYLEGAPVSDLSPLRAMPLTALNLHYTKVSDLSPLKGAPLTDFNCAETAVADLSPLQGAAADEPLFGWD